MSLARHERRGAVAVITLDRPRANAFHPDLVRDLSEALTLASDAGAIVLASSSTGIFSAGWDLPYLLGRDRVEISAFVSSYCGLVRRVFDWRTPVVAALSGHAIAGGLIIAAAADERLAAEGRGELGLSEVLLGLPVPRCLLEVFRYAIGPRRAERLAATGENWSVDRAFEAGLIDRIVPASDLLSEAVSRAAFLAGRPAEAHAEIKRRSRAAALARFDAGISWDPFLDVWFGADAQSRIAALVAGLTRKSQTS